MRADRLVAILLMLQARGQVTAAEVADELEVSERTARRDLDALGVAGLPIYSIQGRGGGWRLAGDGRTDLSGLTSHEARALFLVAGPSSGATPEVRAALRWTGGSQHWRFAGEVPADDCVRIGTLAIEVPDAPGPLELTLELTGPALPGDTITRIARTRIIAR